MIGFNGIDRRWRPRCGKAVRRNLIVNVAISAIATSCSGGGGGGGAGGNLQANPNGDYLSSIADPSAPALPGDWSASQEYTNSTGLAQLKAAEGYARRSGGLPGGQGVRIAIIDSGIDVSHPDLGNLAATSWTAGGEALSGDSHATFVAGIAGATRTQSGDPNDMHGMAYRATLVNFQASRPSETAASGSVNFATGDLVDAMLMAAGRSADSAAVESDIFNLSLGAFSGSDSTFARLRTAMRAAASEDKIMVFAAGNDGQNSDPAVKSQPIYPAAYADDPGIAGLAIVVGNLTANDQAAASSNHCGDTRDYCLFAPGTNVRSTLNDDAYGVGSGTSFAAPYVSGAAAVVKAAFPGVSSRDVVDRLLLTAEDLGEAGVDLTFGRGKLDLEAAMAPVGPTGFPIGPTVGGPIHRIEESGLRLGPGLALNASATRLLARAMAVDSMGFPFPVDLGKAVREGRRESGLGGFVGDDRRSIAAGGHPYARFAAFVPEDMLTGDTGLPRATPSGNRARDDEVVPLSFTVDIADDAVFFASMNGGGGPRLGLGVGLEQRRATFMQADGFLSPYAGFAAAPSVAGFSYSPAEGTDIALSAFTSKADRGEAKVSLQRVEVMRTLPGDIELRAGLGLMQEEGGFAGGNAGGAFGSDMSARSQFLTISLAGPLAGSVDWFATYTRGRSSIGEAEEALLSDWSDTHSEAFGAGLVIRDLASKGDGVTLMVGQPLRQDNVRATIDLPVARNPDGSIVRERETLDLTPDAREITTEIGYRLPLGDDGRHDLRTVGFLRFNPDHDPDRHPQAGIGLAYHWRF